MLGASTLGALASPYVLAAKAAGQLPATKNVVIAVYGGDWEKNVRAAGLDDFAHTHGINVQVVPGADAQWFTKLRASNGKNPPYDVLVFQPDTIQRAVDAKLLQPLDAEHIPDLKQLSPSVQKRLTFDGHVYAAGFSLGQLGLAYREDLLPIKLTSWMDLWRPELKGHVAISPLTYTAGLQFFAGLIHAQGGQMSNPADVTKAFDKLAQLKPNISALPNSPGAIQTLLERGEIWVVPFWDGRIFAMQKQGLKVGFTYPSEGAVVGAANWVIAKGSPNLKNAYDLVNFLSSTPVQASFADKMFYAMNNEKVVYDQALRNKIKTGDEAYAKLVWIDYSVASPNLAQWSDRWSAALGKA